MSSIFFSWTSSSIAKDVRRRIELLRTAPVGVTGAYYLRVIQLKVNPVFVGAAVLGFGNAVGLGSVFILIGNSPVPPPIFKCGQGLLLELED